MYRGRTMMNASQTSRFNCVPFCHEFPSRTPRGSASQVLEQSHRIATELGMRPLRERIEPLRAGVGVLRRYNPNPAGA